MVDIIDTNISRRQVSEDSEGVVARGRLKEARVQESERNETSEAVSRRTETAYKAQSPGELAGLPFRVQHNEAQGSGDRVNAALGVSRWSLTCAVKVHVLIPLKGVLS